MCDEVTHPEDDVVAEHEVFVAAADLSVRISIVIHLSVKKMLLYTYCYIFYKYIWLCGIFYIYPVIYSTYILLHILRIYADH